MADKLLQQRISGLESILRSMSKRKFLIFLILNKKNCSTASDLVESLKKYKRGLISLNFLSKQKIGSWDEKLSQKYVVSFAVEKTLNL